MLPLPRPSTSLCRRMTTTRTAELQGAYRSAFRENFSSRHRGCTRGRNSASWRLLEMSHRRGPSFSGRNWERGRMLLRRLRTHAYSSSSRDSTRMVLHHSLRLLCQAPLLPHRRCSSRRGRTRLLLAPNPLHQAWYRDAAWVTGALALHSLAEMLRMGGGLSLRHRRRTTLLPLLQCPQCLSQCPVRRAVVSLGREAGLLRPRKRLLPAVNVKEQQRRRHHLLARSGGSRWQRLQAVQVQQ
jgi:hypothetical protein